MTEPVIQAAEQLLHPLAAAALADAKAYAQQEAAAFEAELPGLLANLSTEAHDLASAALTHLHNIVDRIDQHLTGHPAAQ